MIQNIWQNKEVKNTFRPS